MILTPALQDVITIGIFLLILAAGIYIWPPERPQHADKLHDHAPETGTPQSAESVRRWNAWIEHCQADLECRRRLDELMSGQ